MERKGRSATGGGRPDTAVGLAEFKAPRSAGSYDTPNHKFQQREVINRLVQVLTFRTQDHFDLVLPLLEEMLASGRPLLTSTSQLKELVLPPPKVFAKVANAAGCVFPILHSAIVHR